MARPSRVLLLYGTRPEAIKMAPVVAALRRRPDRFALTLCATAQHREMLDQVQALFELEPDLDLGLMRPDQTPNELAARTFAALDPLLAELRPDWVLVQGDTTTAMAGAFAGFHRRVPVAHVEAGLRTGDLAQPFPEEANRRVVDMLASALFAPTPGAAERLRAEGVPSERVFVTGNTVVDALQAIAARTPAPRTAGDEVLVTVHRRESFGAPLARVFAALRDLAAEFPAVRWIYPVHPNPSVEGPVRERLTGVPNLELLPPLDYREMVQRLRACRFVLTDSGGLQEEAPTFGKPVLVLREKTERPEGVEAGIAKLVGTDPARIVVAARRLLTDPVEHRRMTAGGNPYGDGRAAERIAAVLAGEEFVPFRERAAA